MNLYKFFGVDTNFSTDEIKKAFKKKVKFWHPDRSKYEKDLSERVFKFIKSSYDTLTNPKLRKIYDDFYKEIRMYINVNDTHGNSQDFS